MGNKSCFRNEKYNSKAFIMPPDWQIPHTGTFEFDYMCLIDTPDIANIVSDD
jgi:hypothetical protein